MQPLQEKPRWYALSVYTRQEKSAVSEISRLGFESFLPTHPVRKLWSDRIKKLDTPLLPGYLFIHINLTPETRVKLIRLRSIFDLVGKQKYPELGLIASPIPDSQINSLKAMLQSKQLLEPTTQLLPGTEVMISQGPLKGVCGVVEKAVSGKRRIIVQLPLLGRGIRTELSADDVLSYQELAR
ncbi:MAG: UpxY family transcription antiterminator [Deltaproteobacteria bacterium]|nr:UpxY family transcription antiterminator [Deltaproteobacteria bacterium]